MYFSRPHITNILVQICLSSLRQALSEYLVYKYTKIIIVFEIIITVIKLCECIALNSCAIQYKYEWAR